MSTRCSKAPELFPVEDLWILHRLDQVSAEMAEALDKFRFHDASSLIYQFIWHELCDWYIELAKPILTDPAAPAEERSRRVKVLIHVVDYALRLLHPFMPFITEEIWQQIPHSGASLMVQEFPQPRALRYRPEAAQAMQDLMDLVAQLRSARSEMGIDPKRTLDASLVLLREADRELVTENTAKIRKLARLDKLDIVGALPSDRFLLKGVWRLGEFGLDLEGIVDFKAERDRLERELGKVKAEIDKVARKISSHEFMARAPEEVVAENRTRHAELLDRFQKLESNLGHLPQ